jgi:hypothetical protein
MEAPDDGRSDIRRVSIHNDKGDISDITPLFKSQTDFRKIGLGSAWVGLPESILNINAKGTFSLKVEYNDENTGNSHPDEISTIKIIDLQGAP